MHVYCWSEPAQVGDNYWSVCKVACGLHTANGENISGQFNVIYLRMLDFWVSFYYGAHHKGLNIISAQ